MWPMILWNKLNNFGSHRRTFKYLDVYRIKTLKDFDAPLKMHQYLVTFTVMKSMFMYSNFRKYTHPSSDMEFVKNFTHPDFQAKSFTPQKCVICDSFFAN